MFFITIATEGLDFSGDTLEKKALGGSETAVISVAKEFSKLGNNVTVYCRCDNEGVFDGVTYRDVSRFNDFISGGYADIFIASRFFQFLGRKLNTKLNILWNHDTLADEIKSKLLSCTWNIDYMYCLSNYHKDHYIKQLPELGSKPDYIKLNTNGIDPDLLPKKTEKKHKIMYTSRPERGLLKALEIYEKLNDKDLEFLVCNYATIDNDIVRRYETACVNKINELISNGFKITQGQFSKKELYKNIAESKAVIYPTEFQEISCISGMEAQWCGTVYLTTNDFALKETIGYKGFDLDKNYDNNIFNSLKEILDNEILRTMLEKKGFDHVANYTWAKVAEKFLSDATDYFVSRSHNNTSATIERFIYESDFLAARELLKEFPDVDLQKRVDNALRFVDGKDDYKNIYEDTETHNKDTWENMKKSYRYNFVAKQMRKHGVKNILDYACHTGWSSIIFKYNIPVDCEVTGYDISEKAISLANKNKKEVPELGSGIDFTADESLVKNNLYDALFAGEYLEHVADPVKEIDRLESFISDGGKMFITLPMGAWEHHSRAENQRKNVYYHVSGFDYRDVIDMVGHKKDFKIAILPSKGTAMFGEPIGNFYIEYTVDRTPTNKRDYMRKFCTQRPFQKVSCCIIAKNAEQTIESTLESLKDQYNNYWVDEIIVGNDHSTDRTAERAKGMGAKVIDLPQTICSPDNAGFSYGRNFVSDHASGEWIFWIDSDEKMKGVNDLRKFLDNDFLNAYIILQHHPMIDSYIDADKPQRIFRKFEGRFEGIIHEQPQSNKDINETIEPSLIIGEASIVNLGSLTENERRGKAINRNAPLLEKDWQVNVLDRGNNHRKLTVILVMRDWLNRMNWQFEKFGSYDTPEVKKNILPHIMWLKKNYTDKYEGTFKDLSENILQDVYKLAKIGEYCDIKIGDVHIKKYFPDFDHLVKELKSKCDNAK